MKNNRGFSLVELMVALTIGLILGGAMLYVFSLNSKSYGTQGSYSRLQENARFALAALERNVRMAGFQGCASGNTKNTPFTINRGNVLTGPTGYLNNFSTGIEGYEASASAWTPALNANISGATPAPAAGSDIITVRMGSGTGTPLTADMANAGDDIPVASTTGFAAGTTAVIANCTYSTVFNVTAANANSTLSHGTGSGNSVANLNRAYGMDAWVFPISTVTYYLARSSAAPTGTEKSLWQMVNGTSTELVEGVEDMQILYGNDTNSDLSPDSYVTANSVTNTDNIVSVKISLLMRTLEDGVAGTRQSYTFNGVPNITPGDNRVRRTFNVTIALRNRTN